MKVFDGETDSEADLAIHLEYIQIHPWHFCKFSSLYKGPVDMVVLMLLNLTSLNTLNVVYVKMLVILKEHVKVS